MVKGWSASHRRGSFQHLIERAKRRCEMAGLTPDLRVSDAEHLLFPDDTFDVVYSYGVMHHSPDTPQCIREAWRVLKPGGALRIMIYHHASLTGFMLWLRYGFLRGKSLRQSVRDHLESQAPSPTREKKRARCCRASSKLSCGKPSARRSAFERTFGTLSRVGVPLCLAIVSAFLVRRLGARWGLFLLISARKPAAT